MDAATWLAGQLTATAWRLAHDVEVASRNDGIPAADLKAALEQLGVEEDRGGSKDRRFWRLPKGTNHSHRNLT